VVYYPGLRQQIRTPLVPLINAFYTISKIKSYSHSHWHDGEIKYLIRHSSPSLCIKTKLGTYNFYYQIYFNISYIIYFRCSNLIFFRNYHYQIFNLVFCHSLLVAKLECFPEIVKGKKYKYVYQLAAVTLEILFLKHILLYESSILIIKFDFSEEGKAYYFYLKFLSNSILKIECYYSFLVAAW